MRHARAELTGLFVEAGWTFNSLNLRYLRGSSVVFLSTSSDWQTAAPTTVMQKSYKRRTRKTRGSGSKGLECQCTAIILLIECICKRTYHTPYSTPCVVYWTWSPSYQTTHYNENRNECGGRLPARLRHRLISYSRFPMNCELAVANDCLDTFSRHWSYFIIIRRTLLESSNFIYFG